MLIGDLGKNETKARWKERRRVDGNRRERLRKRWIKIKDGKGKRWKGASWERSDEKEMRSDG